VGSVSWVHLGFLVGSVSWVHLGFLVGSVSWVHLGFLVGSVLLIILLCCVVCLHPVSCVYNFTSVSWLSILDCPFLIVHYVFSNDYLLFRKTYLASVLAHVYLCILWELLLGGDKKQWVVSVLLALSRLGSKIFACCSLTAAAVASVIHEAPISTSSSRGVIYLIRLFTSHSPWSEGFQPKTERLVHISIIRGSLGNYIYISECDVGFCHYLNVSCLFSINLFHVPEKTIQK
jgi:hypothetical protein